MPNPESRKPLMALAPVTPSSNPRRSKPFAIRSFPTFSRPTTASESQPEKSFNITPPPPEPTSCGPGSSFLSYRGKFFRPPIAFAIRKFPKGCGPLASSIPKPSFVARRVHEEKSDMNSSQIVEGTEEKFKDAVRRVSEEGSDLGNVSFGEKSCGNSSVTADFGKDGRSLCRVEGSESDNKIEGIEEKLTDILRRTSKEESRLGKVFKNSAGGKSVGGKNGEKTDRKSSLAPDLVKSGGRFSRPERSETMSKDENMKGKLSNDARRIANERDGIGKVLKSDVVGRSLGENDDAKPNKKRSLAPDRSEEGELLEVRGDRLIVLALMAAKRCPWMQGKGKSSIVSQSTPKKPRIRASG